MLGSGHAHEQATILEAPEGGSRVAIFDLAEPKDAAAAVAAAFAAYKPGLKPTLKVRTKSADSEGWTDRWFYRYQIPPNAKRFLGVSVRRANDVWTVTIVDFAEAVLGKRGSQVGVIFDKLLPKGYKRETFAGKKAHTLNAARLAALAKFVRHAQEHTKVPGVAVGIVQDGSLARYFSIRIHWRLLRGSWVGTSLTPSSSSERPMTRRCRASCSDR